MIQYGDQIADQEIKTGIDALVAYLKEHGEENITVIAAALGVGESSIIEWANILEKANVVTISHKSGKLFLGPVTGEGKPTKETKQAEQFTVQETISSNIAAVDQVAIDLEDFEKSIIKIDNMFSTKYADAKAILDKLNSIETQISTVEKLLAARSAKVKDVSDKARERYEAAQQYLANLAEFSLDTNNARAVSQEIREMIKAYEKNAADMSKELDSVMYKYKKSSLALGKSIKEKEAQLVEVMNFDQRQIKEYERLRVEYKRDRADMTRENKEIGKRVLEEIAKNKLEMEKLLGATTAQLGAVKPKVADMKKDLGRLGTLNDQLILIRTDLDELKKQRDDIMSELKKMQGEAKGGGAFTRKMAESVKDVDGKVMDLREKMAQARKDLDSLATRKG